MRLLLFTLLGCAVLVQLGGGARGEFLPSYDGTSLITWDAHVHAGNSSMFACLTDPGFNPLQGCHSHRWCDDAYQEARARGLHALVLSHHSFQLESPAGLAAWVANAGGYTDAYGAFWPTHEDGYPLLLSGGHTTDEVDALWECAEANDAPGEFLALYGIEFSAAVPTAPGCDVPGQAACGGHKVGIFGTRPEIACGVNAPSGGDPAEICADEGEFYAALDLYSDASNPSAGGAAHPQGSLPAEWEPYADPGARGGASPEHVFGYEFWPSREDVDCIDHSDPPVSPATSECGYRQVLAHGWQVAPWFGSDNHLNPGSRWDNWITGSAQKVRSICLADAFTRAGFVEAIRDRRCYYVRLVTQPRIEFEIDGAPMGETVQTTGPVHYNVYMNRNGEDIGGRWEIGCGEVTGDGTDGNYEVKASGVCTLEICGVGGNFWPDSADWCYLRVSAANGGLRVITAPVFLDSEGVSLPSLSDRGLASVAILLAGLGAAALARMRSPRTAHAFRLR